MSTLPMLNLSAFESSSSNTSGIGKLMPAASYGSAEAFFLVLVLASIICTTIVGNTLVCTAVFLVRKLRKTYNYLIVSLAVSDICVAILVMPMATIYELTRTWPFGDVVCDVWVSFDVLSCTASILNLCMISVDRYLAITRPLDYGVKRTPKKMLFYILIVWIGAALISVPPLLILGNEHSNGMQCIVCQNFAYQIYATLGSFYIPLIVMIVVYYKIFQAAKKITQEDKKSQGHLRKLSTFTTYEVDFAAPANQNHNETSKNYLQVTQSLLNTSTESKESAEDSGKKLFLSVPADSYLFPPCSPHCDSSSNWSLNESHQYSDADTREHATPRLSEQSNTKQRIFALRKRSKFRKVVLASERKASTTLGIIMSAFTICWLPFFVLALIRPFMKDQNAIPHIISSLFLWLGYANSMLNPVIYATLNKDFRTPFKEILCLRCHNLNSLMREEFYQAHFGVEIDCLPSKRLNSCQDDSKVPISSTSNRRGNSDATKKEILL